MQINNDQINNMAKEFSEIAATYKIASDGIEFASQTQFWKWFTSDVVKVGNTPLGEKIALTNSDNIANWATSKFANEKQLSYFKHMLVNRGAEFDFVSHMQNSPIELLKGNIWRMASQEEDLKHGIDAVRYNVFTGKETTIQIKAGLSDSFKRVDLSQYVPDVNQEISERMVKGLVKNHTPTDEVYVNENILKWRYSEKGQEIIAKRGDMHPNTKKMPMNDKQLHRAGDKRVDKAAMGKASPNITVSSAMTQIGQGAAIGAVVAVGISAISNYNKYNSGEITKNQFAQAVLCDTAEGALQGGIIAAINIPVQIVASSIGVGAPITIPVMILVGAGVRKVINPIFGKGEYLEDKKDIELTTNIQQALATFSDISCASYETTKGLLSGLVNHKYNLIFIDSINKSLDKDLDSLLEDI